MLYCPFIFNASDMKFMKRCCATTSLRFLPSKPLKAHQREKTQAMGIITNLNRDAPLLSVGDDFSAHGIFAQRLQRRLKNELKSR